jgi:hypothetical protein
MAGEGLNSPGERKKARRKYTNILADDSFLGNLVALPPLVVTAIFPGHSSTGTSAVSSVQAASWFGSRGRLPVPTVMIFADPFSIGLKPGERHAL